MRIRLVFVVGLGLLASACSTYPQSPQPANRAAAQVSASASASVSVSLSAEQAALVRAHMSSNGSGHGNGRGNSGRLPPGIERNLARGKALPPGIAKQYLPSDLIVRLPALPRGIDYVVAGGKLLLVEVATSVVREILLDVIA